MKYGKMLLIAGAVFLCGLILYYLVTSNFMFVTTYYKIFDKRLQENIRIAHLSDVHNCEFGEKNRDLLDAVAQSEPDLIFVTGDSIHSGKEETGPAVRLMKELVKIAPVYYSYGNHEMIYQEAFGQDIGMLMEEAGAKLLNFDYEDIEIRGQQLRIGGIYGYCTPEEYLSSHEFPSIEGMYLKDFQNTDRFTMLLCHMPYAWLVNDGISKWNVDAVFSGHSHGGQWILPLIGPVYAPDQGFFPNEVSGQFVSGDGRKNLIVSKGLGNIVIVPRWNNQPELVIVDIGSDVQ